MVLLAQKLIAPTGGSMDLAVLLAKFRCEFDTYVFPHYTEPVPAAFIPPSRQSWSMRMIPDPDCPYYVCTNVYIPGPAVYEDKYHYSWEQPTLRPKWQPLAQRLHDRLQNKPISTWDRDDWLETIQYVREAAKTNRGAGTYHIAGCVKPQCVFGGGDCYIGDMREGGYCGTSLARANDTEKRQIGDAILKFQLGGVLLRGSCDDDSVAPSEGYKPPRG